MRAAAETRRISLQYDLPRVTGAAAAHAATGDGVRLVLVQLVLAALFVASWTLRPEGRRLRQVRFGARCRSGREPFV
jgi:hypothetical protein